MEVQLVIRAPNQNIEDQFIKCEEEWTVLRLKAHLSKVYPSKPAISKQKLIYSGHLLLDHLQLKEYLRSEEQSNVHILHLVYNGHYSPPSQNRNSMSRRRSSSQSSHPQSSGLSDSVSSTENVLRHRTHSVAPQMNNFQMPVGALPVFYNDPQAIAQMTAMQHAYAQYMAQYWQSMNIAASTGNPPVLPVIPNVQQPHTPSNAAAEAPAQQQGNQRVNAVEIVPDNDIGRDWLDNIFQYCRFLILLSIVYFYSTPERFMLVILCAVIALLYREGWFMRQTLEEAVLRRIHNVQAEAPAEAANIENEHAPSNQEELHDGQELEAAMDGENPPHVQNPDVVNNNQGFSALSILAAFFFSLVPEPPPPVNIN